ncbi:MAG: hypothetical protein HUU02_13995, partial [Bacteroidetes bacterium]|nr:hypothetical protein [Bacteroidota bacterium]
MTNRPLRLSFLFLVLFAQFLPSSAKDKRRPDASADAVRMIGTPMPSSLSAVPSLQQPGEIVSPESATSLDAFHRNTLPVNIADRYVYMVTKKVGVVFAIGEDGLIARANDVNLQSWTMVNSGIGSDEDVYAIEGSGSGILLAGTSAGKIYRSTNTGLSWSLVYWNPAEYDFINYIKTTDNGAGFIAVGDAAVSGTPMGFLTSTNSGTSWTNLNTNITGATHPNGVRFIGTMGFLNGTATQGGRTYRGIFRTLNSGATWSFFTVGNTTADSSVGVAAIDFSSSTGRGLAVKFDSTLWKSTNSGATWTLIAQLPRMGYSICFLPGVNTAYVVGRNGLITNVDVENNIVQSVLMDEQQVFTQVQFASTTEGYINDDLARRRYYSTVNVSGVLPGTPVTSLSALRNTNEAELSWTSIAGAVSYDLEIGVIVNSVFRSEVVSTTGTAVTRGGLAPGVQYRWRVRARNLANTGLWSGFRTFITSGSPRVKADIAAFPSKPTSSTDYRMVYIPSQSGIPLSILMTGNPPNDYRVFRDNGGIPPSHLTEMSSIDVLSYSAGAWLIKKDEFEVDVDMDYPSVAFGSVDIPTSFGWNIIGNPFPVPVKWSDVLARNGISAGTVSSTVYEYFGDQGYGAAQTLQPFRGYYFFSTGGSLSIPFPYTPTPDITVTEPAGTLRITYRSAVNTDRSIMIGTDPAAAEQLDGFDLRKPPVFADQGAVWFERPEWDAEHSRFSGDVRPSYGDGQIWNFTVQHPVDGPATLTLEQRERIPAGYEAVFVDRSNGMLLPVDGKGAVQLPAKQTAGAYAVVIG